MNNHAKELASLVAAIERQYHGARAEIVEASLKRAIDAYVDGLRRALEVDAAALDTPLKAALREVRLTKAAVVEWVDEQSRQMRLVTNEQAPGWLAYVTATTARNAILERLEGEG